MPKRELPEVNASSLADIAFLLLTFFLVATTLNKPTGLHDKLPDPNKEEEISAPVEVTENNTLLITIDDNNTIRIRDKVLEKRDITAEVIKFLDNGRRGCDFCKGKKLAEYSDNPSVAVVQLKRTNQSTFAPKFTVEGEVASAYEFMRNRYALEKFNRSWKSIESHYQKSLRGNTEFEKDTEIIAMYQEIDKEKIPKKFSRPDPVETLN